MSRLAPEQAASLSLREFRELVQAPVRAKNDLGGVLFGDWASPVLSRAFLRWGLSPTVATVGMLVVGLAGAAILPLGGLWSLLAALLFLLFYVLDCVDGEVARLRGVDRFFWSYPDFFFGVGVMALFYLSLGLYGLLFVGSPWWLALGGAAAVLLLLRKLAEVSHVFLTVLHVLDAAPEQRARYAGELAPWAASDDGAGAPASRGEVLQRYGRGFGLARAALLNFHLSMLLFAVLCAADLFVGPWRIAGAAVDLKSLFLPAYALLLSAHLADYFTHLWRGGFLRRSAALYRRLAPNRWDPGGSESRPDIVCRSNK